MGVDIDEAAELEGGVTHREAVAGRPGRGCSGGRGDLFQPHDVGVGLGLFGGQLGFQLGHHGFQRGDAVFQIRCVLGLRGPD